MQPYADTTLDVMVCGQVPPNPSELLQSHAMEMLLLELRSRYDVVILDAPPLLPVTDAAVLSAHADGVLVVVRAGRTTRQQLTLAMRTLNAVGARVLGTVLNMAPTDRGSSYEAYRQAGTTEADHGAPKDDSPVNGSGRGAHRYDDDVIGDAAASGGRRPDMRA
jgi:Mrp family chromosome partitioning ATPase